MASKRRRGRGKRAACDDDDDDDVDFEPVGAVEDVPVAYAPAYNLKGGCKKRRTVKGKDDVGPQCSEHPDEFCFFCAYEKDPNAEAGSSADLYGSLVDLVNSMQRQGKEFPAIVDAVAVAYETQIRPHVHDPDFGEGPEWLATSIQRHLTFSNQFGAVFEGAVTQVFHALISKQNECVLDGTTGLVIEENRCALMNTLDHYMKWQRFQRGGAGGKRGKRP